MAEIVPTKQFETLYQLLRSGRKVVSSHVLYYVEDMNPYNEEGQRVPYSSSLVKRTAILYMWTNPQQNRLFAMLADKRKVDYDLSYMDICWNRFEEYDPPVKPESWRWIIDTTNRSYETIGAARVAADQVRYPYFLWNHGIYRTKDGMYICSESEIMS